VRWKELADLQNEAARHAWTYLMVTNSGGAVTVLSFMGAMKSTTPISHAPAMLIAFVLGLIIVGFGRAAAYYRISYRYARWRKSVDNFFDDNWTWDQVLADDKSMGWTFLLGDILAWASFACLLTGIGLGVTSVV